MRLLISPFVAMYVALASASPLAGEVLKLQQAINLARSHSPTIKKQQAASQAQGNHAASAWADTGPRGQVAYNWVRFQDQQVASFGPAPLVVRPQETRAGSFTLSQPLTGFYALMQMARIEGIKKDLAENTAQLTDTLTAFATAELYIRAQQLAAMSTLSQNRIAAGEAIQKEGQALFRAGKIHKGDALKLDLVLSEAKSSAAKIAAQRDILYATVKEQIGYADQQTVTLPQIEAVSLPPLPEQKIAVEKALLRRTEFHQAKRGVEIAKIGNLYSYSAYWPQVNAFAQWSRQYGEIPFGQEAFTRTYGISATWDIWDNGSRLFKTREVTEVLLQTEYELTEVQRKIKLEVIESIANLQAARETVSLAKGALEQATEAHRIESSRFRAGSSRASELVLSEAAEANAESNWISAIADVQSQQYKLQRVQGDAAPTVL